jgi:ferredoxin-NADP reductase
MPGSALTQIVASEIVEETGAIVSLRLERADGRLLAPFEPGAHIELHIPNGVRRHYSLCSDPDDLSHYEIAVLREPKSRGGSAYIHEQLDVGDGMLISAPRPAFSLVLGAASHVLIAGGIGIAPLLPMLHRLRGQDARFELHYLARGSTDAAFLDRVTDLIGPDRLHTWFSRDNQRFATGSLVARAAAGAQIYCCGPERLMRAVREALVGCGGPAPRFETFVAPVLTGVRAGDPFEVEILSSGQIVAVSAEETLLEALNTAGFDIAFSCEHGICGTCLVEYRGGDPLHRDGVLTASLRARCLTACVSRGRGRLVLDL